MSNKVANSPLSPANNPAVIAHINLLQGIINRLANNSSSCKTWCLTLVAALLGLAGAIRQPQIVIMALVPITILGLIDAFYLAQEMAYRALYARVVKTIRNKSYSLNDSFEAEAPLTVFLLTRAVLSWSIFPLYGGLILGFVVAVWAGWTNRIADALLY